MNPATPIRVDVWSDVQCIWCYISSARLRTAIARHLGLVEVTYHSFQLSPTRPSTSTVTRTSEATTSTPPGCGRS